jgi:hypothetical protein
LIEFGEKIQRIETKGERGKNEEQKFLVKIGRREWEVSIRGIEEKWKFEKKVSRNQIQWREM